MSQPRWIRIFETRNLAEASIVQGLLEENGLPVQVLNKQDSSYLMGYAEIYVPETCLPAVEMILAGNYLN